MGSTAQPDPTRQANGRRTQVAWLDSNRRQDGARLPFVAGTSLIPDLSAWTHPTLAVGVTLHVEGDGERLLKQVTLWIQGQDGWRYQRTLADLHRGGYVELTENGLQINLVDCLSSEAQSVSLEFRDSLRPIYPVPILFAVVPGLGVEPPRVAAYILLPTCPSHISAA